MICNCNWWPLVYHTRRMRHSAHQPIVNQLNTTGRQTGIRWSSNQLHWGFVVTTTTETDKLKTIFQYGWMAFCRRTIAAARLLRAFCNIQLHIQFQLIICTIPLCYVAVFVKVSGLEISSWWPAQHSHRFMSEPNLGWCIGPTVCRLCNVLCVHGYCGHESLILMRSGFHVEIEMKATRMMADFRPYRPRRHGISGIEWWLSNRIEKYEIDATHEINWKEQLRNQLFLEMLCI